MTEDLPEEATSDAPIDEAVAGTEATTESGAIGSVVTSEVDDDSSIASDENIDEGPGVAIAPSRNRTRTIIAAVVVVLLLAGVGIGFLTRGGSSKAADPSTPTTLATHSTKLDDVKVSGNFGEKPTVTFKPAYVGTEETFKVISQGDGPVVVEGQRVTLDYVAYSGADGSELDSTFGKAPQAVTASHTSLTKALADALVGQTVGSRVMVAGDQTQAQSGAWVIFVFDIKSAEDIPTSASGTEQAPKAGFPTVTVENGIPKIGTPTGTPPTPLDTAVLIKGNGPVVASGQTVTMHYTGVVWATGKEFDSSWSGDPVDFPIGSGQVIPGFDEGLIGQTVGSRVVLVIPPDKGYGSAGNTQAGISGTDTLVFVVDILAAS
jgi:peptidylprolyl isomerase